MSKDCDMIRLINFRQKRDFAHFECLADAEAHRVRKVRRNNFQFFLVIWVGFFAYAFWRFLSAGTIESALDRFLPLQLVAGLAAMLVFLGGRSLGRKTNIRKLRFVPVAVTSVGIGVAAITVLATSPRGDFPVDPSRSSEVQQPSTLETVLISL